MKKFAIATCLVLVAVMASFGIVREGKMYIASGVGSLTDTFSNPTTTKRYEITDVIGVFSVATNAAETVTLTKNVIVSGGVTNAVVYDTGSVAASNTVLKVDCDYTLILNPGETLTITRTTATTNGTLGGVIVYNVTDI